VSRVLLLCIGFVIALPNFATAALLPPIFVNSVVALGEARVQPTLPGQVARPEWQTEGTGFFYGYIAADDIEQKDKLYRVFLITARHVIENHFKQHGNSPIKVRVNPQDASAGAPEFEIPISNWHFHHENGVDVALVSIRVDYLEERGIRPNFFTNDALVANREKMRDLGVSAGDGIFVLGFPMNLAGVQRNYVIVRQGCIARINEMLDKVSTTFMLDAFIFPGNSGGPVILKPEVVSIQGTKALNRAYLIGIVLSYRPYTDVAISPQTGRPRVLFEENSGLAEVLPTDYIDEAIEYLLFFQFGAPSPM
jgi:hypothetical protein